eukprot:XP_003728192.1 PREDICTED: muscarinic acetylcholine receptor M3-like [Strongylocentrotus purpuratus]
MAFWTEATNTEMFSTVQSKEWTDRPFEPAMTFGQVETDEDSVMSSSIATMASSRNASLPDNVELFEFTFENCLFIVLASLMSLTTVLANVILIILMSVDAKLRRYSNYYIISLACADLVVGIFVIPMFSLYTILGRWPLGSIVCELWIIIDFSCVSASVFSICMISVDRYWAVTQPLKHLKRQRRKRSLLIVCAIWILAGLCWIPGVLAHRFILGSFAVDSACLYLPGFTYTLLSNTIIFFCPMVVMVCLYAKMLYALKRHLRSLTEATMMESVDPTYARTFCCCRETINPDSTLAVDHTQSSISTISFSIDSSPTLDVINTIGRHMGATHSNSTSSETLGTNAFESTSRYPGNGSSTNNPAPSSRVLQETHLTQKPLQFTKNAYSNGLRAERVHQRHLANNRLHQRTAQTLGIIVVSFVLCWIFFVILFPVNSYCDCVPLWLYDMSYWLAYMNSTLNPFLYGFNKDFRRAFRRLICPSKKSERNSFSN